MVYFADFFFGVFLTNFCLLQINKVELKSENIKVAEVDDKEADEDLPATPEACLAQMEKINEIV